LTAFISGLSALLFGYLLICALAFLLQRQLIYLPQRSLANTPADVDLPYNEHQLVSSDNVTFPVWEIPASGDVEIVFFHGNAENISHNLDTYRILNQLGVTVWAVEYRGYLKATGTPTEQGITLDLRTLSEFLRNRRGSGQGRLLVAMGRSLGGAVAAKFADLHGVEALILESTFTSMKAMARRSFFWLPVGLILREHYQTLDLVPAIECPILVIHSREDDLIPFSMAEQLAAAGGKRSRLVEISGPHNGGFLRNQERYRACISSFLRDL
jgi:fermentation-respiration switch protein FrsA (DUF1100 family)